jgi:negative regulator of flagellin synthesis FlgM
MKIDPGPKKVTPPQPAENRPVQARTGKTARPEQTDVTLSPRSAQLKELEARLAAIPVVDRARVDSIKAAIASGQYAVNAENIAEGLLDEVKEMLHVARK